MSTDLKELLQRRAEDMRLPPDLPPATFRRARRRRGWTAAFAGVTTITLIAGTVVALQSTVFSSHRRIGDTPTPSSSTEPTSLSPVVDSDPFPGLWPAGSAAAMRYYEREVEQGRQTWLLDPWETSRRFAFDVLGWRSSDVHVTMSNVSDETGTHAFMQSPTVSVAAVRGDVVQRLDLARIGSPLPIWMVTGASSSLFTVRCPDPAEESVNTRTPLHVCGKFIYAEPFQRMALRGWSVAANIEYADSALAPSAAAIRADLKITGTSFDGHIAFSETSDNSDVSLTTVVFARDGSIIGLDARRLGVRYRVGSEPIDALPAAVNATRDVIRQAAGSGSYDELRPLLDDRFSFTFGEVDAGLPVADQAIARWRQDGFEPLRIMGALLEMPYTTESVEGRTVYVWPGIIDWTPDQLERIDESEWRSALESIYPDIDAALRSWIDYGGYIGWRIGIADDGRWMFFIAGD